MSKSQSVLFHAVSTSIRGIACARNTPVKGGNSTEQHSPTETVLMPCTDSGNDPSDYRDDPAATEVLKGEVERQHRAQRIAMGLSLSQPEIDKRLSYLELCREFTARTGKALIPHDEAVRVQYEADLKREGVL